MVVKIRIAVSMFVIVIGLTNCIGSEPVPLIAVPMPRPYIGEDFAQRNRLLNGDVEQGSHTPAHWRSIGPEGAQQIWDQTMAHGGQRSLLLTGTVNADDTNRTRWVSEPPIAVAPRSYVLRLWVRSEQVNAGSVWIRLLYHNAQGDVFHKDTRKFGALPSWTEAQMLITPPFYGDQSERTATSLQVSLELDNSKGFVWFDDIALVEVTDQEAQLLRPIGHFVAPELHIGKPPIQSASAAYSVQQINGVWWLVAPNGRAFWRIGVNDIDISQNDNPCHYQNMIERYTSKEAYQIHARQAATELGFNGDGGIPTQARIRWLNFSANPKVTTASLSLQNAHGDSYRSDEGEFFGDPFNPEWRDRVVSYLDKSITQRDLQDPNLIGYFTDNEMSFEFLYDYIWSPYSRREFVENFLPNRYDSIEQLNSKWSSNYYTYKFKRFDDIGVREFPIIRGFDDPVREDLVAFARVIVAEYINFTTSEIRKRDTIRLVVSNRFAASDYPNNESNELADYIDLFNAYDLIAVNVNPHRSLSGDHYVLPVLETLQNLFYAKTGRPIIISEFGVGALDSGINPVLRWRQRTLATQAQRGVFYQNAVSVFANLPFIVGASWFKWNNSYYQSNSNESACLNGQQDSNDPYWDARNSGIVDDADQFYPDLAQSMRSVNRVVNQIDRTAAFGLGNLNTATIAYSPPDVPKQIHASVLDKKITLQWQLGDEPDLAGYIIYRDDQIIATTVNTSWSGSLGTGKHFFRVAAYDINSNTSLWSEAIVLGHSRASS